VPDQPEPGPREPPDRRAGLDEPVVRARLTDDEVMWLTTVDRGGRPQSSPVWFHWNGDDLLVLSQPGAPKVANVVEHPLVALHLDGAQAGSTVVTIEAVAEVVSAEPGRLAAYAAKYADGFAHLGTDAGRYLAEFSAPIVLTPTRARVFPSL
jgi:PPOX class probable F420-dependent enzyme